jgi:predicted TPR repeat methyltransferase
MAMKYAIGAAMRDPEPAAPARQFLSSGDLLADRRYQVARELEARGDPAAAADVLAQALELAPGFASAWFALGVLRERLGDPDGAITAFRRALAADADDLHGAGLQLARLGVEDPARAMSAGYVRSLFDQYAPRFDRVLPGTLGYRGPQLLRDAVGRACTAHGRPMRFASVLDLGCGTGLTGAAFRDAAGTLVGVDIAPRMVAAARQKGLYDRLETGDLMQGLAAEQAAGRRYDLVLAADVFVYVADLGPVSAAAAGALDRRGLFAFTVETHPGAGVVLGETLRYAHALGHVRTALAAAGLGIAVCEEAWARAEAGVPAPGLVVVASR